MKCRIYINDKAIEYTFERKNIKNINLRIKPDGSIYVSAPQTVDVKETEAFVKSKADMIFNALQKYKECEKTYPIPRLYTTGEPISFLGELHHLAVVKAVKNKIFSDGNILIMWVTDTNNLSLKQKNFDKWLKCEAEMYIKSIVNRIYPYFEAKGIKYPAITYRKMVSRWGSCQPEKGIVTFNTALMFAPSECIEYVVVHEFCHFLQANHSNKFYCEVEKILSDYRDAEKILKKIMINKN